MKTTSACRARGTHHREPIARYPMRPIQQISGNFRDMPPLLRAPLPGPSMEDLDAPASSRGLTSLPEVRRARGEGGGRAGGRRQPQLQSAFLVHYEKRSRRSAQRNRFGTAGAMAVRNHRGAAAGRRMTTVRSQHAQRHPWHLAQRMMRTGSALLPLAVATLLLGMAIYHWVEG